MDIKDFRCSSCKYCKRVPEFEGECRLECEFGYNMISYGDSCTKYESAVICKCDDGTEDSGVDVDDVNHPSHYETGEFECIKVMEEVFGLEYVLHFCVCNAFKYIYRHKRKSGLKDMKKAKWYIDYYIEKSEENS